MKIEGTRGPGRSAATGKSGSAPKASAAAGPASASRVPTDSVSVLGIPEAEFTPKVREAVTSLLQEVSRLSQELDDMRRRMENLETFADQDDLLPILNRRAFVRELSRIKSFGERYELKAALLYIDLNDFKPINDTHGHGAGDLVLKELASTLVKNLRESDIVGRLGGDEFGIVLPNATADDALKKAASLARVIERMKVPFEGHSLQVTAAIGSCALTKDMAIEDAMAAADKAMFENKGDAKRD